MRTLFKIILIVAMIFIICDIEAIDVKKFVQSENLTIAAQNKINAYKFKEAYKLLQKAILVNPDNEIAKKLYMPLYEMFNRGKKKQTRGLAQKRNKVKPVAQRITGCRECMNDCENYLRKKREKAYKDFIAKEASLKVGVKFAWQLTQSNYLPFLNAETSLLATGFELFYFPSFLGKLGGIHLDYHGGLVNILGDSRIKFLSHRATGDLILRGFFFVNNGMALEAGIMWGYHYYNLQNLKTEGAYFYRSIWGPSVGIYIREPLLGRFVKNSFLKKSGIELKANVILNIDDNTSPVTGDFYGGIYIGLKNMDIGIGYRFYSIWGKEVTEYFQDIIISIQWRL